MSSSSKVFAHIYVEEAVQELPLTQKVLDRFPSAEVILIRDYQSVFGRSRQNFRAQKKAPKLILAEKKDQFIYDGNAFIQNPEAVDFCYNGLVLNCLYDCQYCYLQGMYNGGNVVLFANQEPFYKAAEKRYEQSKESGKDFHLAISYDTDLLAFESLFGLSSDWINWAQGKDLCLEIRTKSSPIRFLKEHQATPEAILAWTLSPAAIIKKYEFGTPSLEARLKAIQAAQESGWRVRLCIDPILRVESWREAYGDLIGQLHNLGILERVLDIHLGVFRISGDYLKRMRKNTETDLLHYPFENAKNVVSYNEKERLEAVNHLVNLIKQTGSKKNLILWT